MLHNIIAKKLKSKNLLTSKQPFYQDRENVMGKIFFFFLSVLGFVLTVSSPFSLLKKVW